MKTRMTGGAGAIASHVLVARPQARREVVALDNLGHGSAQAMTRAAQLGGKTVPIIPGGERGLAPVDGISVEQMLADSENGVIVTLAGLALTRITCPGR